MRFNILQQRCLVAARPGKHHRRVGNHCTCRRWRTNRHDFSEVGHISWSRGGIERPVPNHLVVKQLETIQIRAQFLVGAPRNQNPLFGFGILEFLLALDFAFRILDWSPLFIWHPQGPFGFWILQFCPRFDFAYEYAWPRRLWSADYALIRIWTYKHYRYPEDIYGVHISHSQFLGLFLWTIQPWFLEPVSWKILCNKHSAGAVKAGEIAETHRAESFPMLK